MPNTPCRVGEGLLILSTGPAFPAAQLGIVESLLARLGRTVKVEERLMNASTALAGCGPAFMLYGGCSGGPLSHHLCALHTATTHLA